MCKFCDDLKWKTYIVPERTTSADDNQCEFGSPLIYDGEIIDSTCEDCIGCAKENMHFGLKVWENYLSLQYVHRIKKLVVEPYSEAIRINFCPWCGRSLTDKLVDFDKCCLGTALDVER